MYRILNHHGYYSIQQKISWTLEDRLAMFGYIFGYICHVIGYKNWWKDIVDCRTECTGNNTYTLKKFRTLVEAEIWVSANKKEKVINVKTPFVVKTFK